MSLCKMSEILKDAEVNKYGVGCFNVIDSHMARAYIDAATELNSPIIIGTAEVLLDKYGSFSSVMPALLDAARSAKVPVALHLDHSYRFETIMQAMRSGFVSVMFDGSRLSYEQNMQASADITRIAHAMGVEIECELGCVGGLEGDNGKVDDLSLTDPAVATEFMEKTGADFLAISIGTVHGVYKATPKLNLPLLHEIRGKLKQPLVLHGGSGLSDDDFRSVIAGGISKINIYTDIILAGTKAIVENQTMRYEDLMMESEKAMKKAAMIKLSLFGSAGRA